MFGLLESFEDKNQGVFSSQLVRHDEAIEQILDRGQIRPAASGRDIGDIRDPFLVGLAGTKLPVEHIFIMMDARDARHVAEDLPPARHRANVQFVHQAQDCLVVHAHSLVLVKP